MNSIILLFVIQFACNYAQGLECNGPHEYASEVTPVCPVQCNTLHKIICMSVKNQPSCQCKDGTVRDTKSNKCVHLNECPNYHDNGSLVCDAENEVLSQVVSACPPTCRHPVGPICQAVIHKPSCVCAQGTIRDTNTNKCVRRENCPQNNEPLVCDAENEVLSQVVSACPPTCRHPVGPLCMAMIHKPSCVCAQGTIRDTDTNKCVRREHCSQTTKQPIKYEDNKIVCNGLNEKYQEWISACPDHCPIINSPPLPEKCTAILIKPSCVCTNGTIRDTVNNKCVRAEECPQKEAHVLYEDKPKIVCNAPNEQYQEWISACPDHCPSINGSPLPEKCLAIIHKPSCVCTSGTVRDTINNRCVPPKECPQKFEDKPKIVCNALNEVYQEWVSACPTTCPKTGMRPISTEAPLTEKCLAIVHKPSCVCTNGTIRDTINNKCVTRDHCPLLPYSEINELKCGSNERLSPMTTCESSCQRPWRPRCDMVVNQDPSCVCVSGTLRDEVSGKCVPLKDCSKSNYYNNEPLVCEGENEVLSQVVSACPATCRHPVGPLCHALINKPSCMCAQGTIRDTDANKCVRREHCTQRETPVLYEDKPKIICNAPNEQFQEWISACPDHCPSLNGSPLPEKCLAIIHKPSCVCTSGTVRDTINNSCVPPKECPQRFEEKPKIVCNSLNEMYQEWVSACPTICPNRGILPITEVPLPDKCLSMVYKPSCICTNGTIRDTINNKCVTREHCPLIP